MNTDPTGLIFADEARWDTCYAQPFENRMYLVAGTGSRAPAAINECPTGNCFTDRIASTFMSDLATLSPIGIGGKALNISKLIFESEASVLSPVNFTVQALDFKKDWRILPASGLDFAASGKNIIQWGKRPDDAFAAAASMTPLRANQILQSIPASDIGFMRDFYLKFGAETMATNPSAILNLPTPYARALLLQRILDMGRAP